MAVFKRTKNNRYIFDCGYSGYLALTRNPDHPNYFNYQGNVLLVLSPDDKSITIHADGASMMDIETAMNFFTNTDHREGGVNA